MQHSNVKDECLIAALICLFAEKVTKNIGKSYRCYIKKIIHVSYRKFILILGNKIANLN